MSGLNAKAKPFVFNASAGSFTPGGSSITSASAPPASSSPPPGFSAPKHSTSPPPAETFDLHNRDARPLTQPASNSSDSWEELAEDSKAQSTHSIPVNAVNSLAPAADSASPNHSSSPTPTTAGDNISSSATFPDAAVTAKPSTAPSTVDEVTEKADELALDEEEAKELADAADEEATEAVRKPKKDDSERKAHDEREHINIVFIGHVDAGKYDSRIIHTRRVLEWHGARRRVC